MVVWFAIDSAILQLGQYRLSQSLSRVEGQKIQLAFVVLRLVVLRKVLGFGLLRPVKNHPPDTNGE